MKKVLFLSNYSFICLLQIDLTHDDVLFFKCVLWHDSTVDKRIIELITYYKISTYSRNPFIGVRF